ncbi:hypothetical protein WR25_15754 [Diploscapter pachys]|uniref:c-SKI SMAD4-binding domain-containing protein n=1 Tax=Diploscapter pachys TaxID=2018661 RepID=A0A2A2J5M9_9BILA|nr:hypothetical protein WR25_15754 [Diploscapter pachys]
MVREASPIEVISLKKIGKKLLHKEKYFTIITRTDAERIYALLYSKYSSKPLTKGSKRRALFVRDENKTWDMSERIPIQHSGIVGDLDEQDSFQTKDTLSRPAVYGWLFPSRASRRCIICEKCHRKFTIFDFCTHGHYSEKAQETRNRVNKWGFNSCNWFNHIRIAEPFDHVLAYQQFWTDFLSLHLEPKCGTKRRRNLDATLEIQERQSAVGAEKESWDKHKVGFKVARVKQESLWSTYNYGKHWGFRECPNKSLISEYQKLTCNTSTIKLKALWLLAAKEVAYIQMVLADASRGHVLGFDPKAPPSPEKFNNMLPLPAKPTDFARPEDLLNGQSGSGDYEEKAEMERELEEIEVLLESKNGEEKSKCLEKIKNLKSKYSTLQHKTDIVKREYDRIYRNYGLLHATYQIAMDPTTHLDAHVQKQYDIIKEEQRALKSTTITKTDSKDSDGPPVLVAMTTTPPEPSASQEDVIEIVQPSQQAINMKRPYIHKPILQIGEEQRTAILAQEKAAKYMEKYARTIDQNALARTRMRKHDNAAPRLSAGTSSSFQIPNLSGFKPHQSVQLQQPSSKKHKLFPPHMSPASSSSSNVPGQNQPQNQAPSSHVAAAIVGQKQSFLQQAPSPQIGSSKFTHPLLNTVNDQIHQQQQQQQPQQNVLQLHHLLGLVPGPSSSSLSAPVLSAAPIQIQVPSIQINHPVSHNQPSSAFVPTSIQVPQPQQPVQIKPNENPYAQLAASLTPQQLQLQIEATQRILQANQQSSSQPSQAVYTLPASIIQQQPPSLVPSLPQSAVSLQSLFPQLQSSTPNPISLSVSGVSSHPTPGQLTLPLANRDQELNLGSTVSINLLDSLLRQQNSSSNGNNS